MSWPLKIAPGPPAAGAEVTPFTQMSDVVLIPQAESYNCWYMTENGPKLTVCDRIRHETIGGAAPSAVKEPTETIT